jgi:hypothetical protein
MRTKTHFEQIPVEEIKRNAAALHQENSVVQQTDIIMFPQERRPKDPQRIVRSLDDFPETTGSEEGK